MKELLRDHPTFNKILVSTGYVTWGAAMLGLNDVSGADLKLKKALDADPDSAIAWHFWSELKRQKSDTAAADSLRQRALQTSGTFENYADIAALYFQLTWQENQPIMRSLFANPASASRH